MRQLTRAIAFGEPWTTDDADRVAAMFDGLAAEWSERHVDPIKAAPVLDAIDRGGLPLDGRWIELGSGTGAGTRLLHGRVREQISVDLSGRCSPTPRRLAPKVRADSSRLPFADDVADVVLMINMMLFPAEVDRILRPGGHVVWVNTLGDQTPIHLPPATSRVRSPATGPASASHAGTGLWAVLRRA